MRTRKGSLILCAAVSLLCFGCGESKWSESFPGRSQIVVMDSIGVEYGDSSMVFGSISDAEFSSSGEIFVLDQVACCIRKYSPEGDCIQTLLRRGNGPGETVFPSEIALMPGGEIIVRDMRKTSLMVVDENGEQLSEFVDWSLIFPPEAIVAVDSGSFAGYEPNLTAEGSDYIAVFKPALYSLSDAERLTQYMADSMMVVVERMAGSLNGLQGTSHMTADARGRVFYTRSTWDEYEVRCWDQGGSPLFSFSLDIPPVEKTPEEIQRETDYARIRFASMGGTLPEGFEPEPYHNLVENIGVDSQGNLWVQRGTEERPVFDIVSPEGEHAGTAEFPRAGRFWEFRITPYGSLAWNLDPESGVQKVYILDLPKL